MFDSAFGPADFLKTKPEIHPRRYHNAVNQRLTRTLVRHLGPGGASCQCFCVIVIFSISYAAAYPNAENALRHSFHKLPLLPQLLDIRIGFIVRLYPEAGL